MNKTKQSLLAIVIGLTLAAGISYGWIAPTANPPGGNTGAPINVSDTPQTKPGNLMISGFTDLLTTVLTGSVSVGTETVNKNLDVKGMLKILAGDGSAIVTDNSGNVAIGGAPTAGVKLNVAGNIKTGSLTSDGLITTQSLKSDGAVTVAGVLTVNGTLKIPLGACKGCYLVSDANGGASWKQISGSKTYYRDGTFVVPLGITSVKLKMVGGGGGGSSGGGGYGNSENYWWGAGGGGAGSFEGTYTLSSQEKNISVKVGAGGAGGAAVEGLNIGKTGSAGGDSLFGTRRVLGGGGGSYYCTGGAGHPDGEKGNNGYNKWTSKTGCAETLTSNGGKSAYDDGGAGGERSGDTGGNGSKGSGGGGGGLGYCTEWFLGECKSDENSGAGGKGGDGFVWVSWGD